MHSGDSWEHAIRVDHCKLTVSSAKPIFNEKGKGISSKRASCELVSSTRDPKTCACAVDGGLLPLWDGWVHSKCFEPLPKDL